MARTTPAQNPRGWARYTRIDRPLSALKLIPHHPTGWGGCCNIRTTALFPFRPRLATRRHGLCVKNSSVRKGAELLENELCPIEVFWYLALNCRKQSAKILTGSSLYRRSIPIIQPDHRSLWPWAVPPWPSSEEKASKTSLTRLMELR